MSQIKTELNGAIFIAAPRELSTKRFIEIIKRYLPKANLVIGISTEEYVVGFEGQPQFRMLERRYIQPIIDKVHSSATSHDIFVLEYSQLSLDDVIARHSFSRVLLVNGSWKYTFQNHSAYTVLKHLHVPFKYISPFVDESEAKLYESTHSVDVSLPSDEQRLSEADMVSLANTIAKQSYDNSFQTGVALGGKDGESYRFIAGAYNAVIPYQTYALHHGNSREIHGSKTHDTNHYDTIHAEMHLIVHALKHALTLKHTTMFVNVLPCPNCARTLSQTDIEEFVYVHDHSDGYAVDLLRQCGKTVRQLKV